MDSTSLTRLLVWGGIDPCPKLMSFLIKCDITTYTAFCNLKDWTFVEACINYYQRVGSDLDISPGKLSSLQSLGLAVEKHTAFNFNTLLEATPEVKTNYPLLEALNKQVNSHTYSELLQNFSLMLRLKGGRQLHQFVSNNLPLPSTASTDKLLATMDFVTEGELQVSFDIA